jgi:tight adherence protein C
VLTAVGLTVGLLGLMSALHPGRRSLSVSLQVLEADRQGDLSTSPERQRAGLRLDRHLSENLARFISEREELRSRLNPVLTITGTTIQSLCGEVVLGTLLGFLLPAIFWAVLAAGAGPVPLAVPVWMGVLFAAVGGLLPLARLHSRADRARRSARRLIGSFLNLVVLSLAGGMGVESALQASARIGEDVISRRILNALTLAQDSGLPPWEGLDQVGRDLGLVELTDLSAVVRLAGAEGARVRATLAAKAGSIRRRDLADAEARANSVTERLFLPGVLLLVGFLVFIAYPAVSRISSGL